MNSNLKNTGVKGIVGTTGAKGITGRGPYTGTVIGYTGVIGVTGISYPKQEPADLEPIKLLEKKEKIYSIKRLFNKNVIRYRSKQAPWMYHCPFGPADSETNKWYINGKELDKEDIKLAVQILDDITLAPLYLNDPILSYPARWVLKYGSEKRDVDKLTDISSMSTTHDS